jgi:hypothetical protein
MLMCGYELTMASLIPHVNENFRKRVFTVQVVELQYKVSLSQTCKCTLYTLLPKLVSGIFFFEAEIITIQAASIINIFCMGLIFNFISFHSNDSLTTTVLSFTKGAVFTVIC